MKFFVDLAKIYVRAGKGGDGRVAFRREKFVPRGGPSGGNGGKGGDVYLRADKAVVTLYDFVHQREFGAQDGQRGGPKEMTGKSGEDLYLKVPVGTVVRSVEDRERKVEGGFEGAKDGRRREKDQKQAVENARGKGWKEKLLVDLTRHGQVALAAKGGRGGLGNAHFKSATNQTPREHTPGEAGEEKELILELKLIADAGLIGLPNAGKSSLLNALSAARAKIGPYPFTTLHPNLAVTVIKRRQVVLADIPGLIKGASKGCGLGDEFLRHIERTKILVHLVDPLTGCKNQKPAPLVLARQAVQNYQVVRKELADYSQSLLKKPEIIAISKSDITEIKKALPEIIKQLRLVVAKVGAPKTSVLAISAASGKGLPELQERVGNGLVF